MDERCKQILQQGDALFSKRIGLMGLLQTIAENFYPERADFTATHDIGAEFAIGLYDSYPLFIRRELGDFISTLRRKDQEWFEATVEREDRLDAAGRKWLENATNVQRRAMYDRRSQFTRAMKDVDHDYVSFGQGVLTIEANEKTNTLLYQCWHIRDTVWRFALDGSLAEVQRKWNPTVGQLVAQFGKKAGAKLHANIIELNTKNPLTENACRHVVLSLDEYNQMATVRGQTHWELYVDEVNSEIILEMPLRNPKYVIPRWKTLSGTQYGCSPAVTIGLPDARLIQAMQLTMLEAGESAVRPPMAAKLDAIPEGVKLFSGGITGIDAEIDTRIEDVLRPIQGDSRALPFGLDLLEKKQQMLASAFYINKITLPQFEHEMTAFEFSQRLQEYIRNVTPLFEPVDADYHTHVCDQSFQVLMEQNAFGDPRQFPRSVQGDETVFRFDNPLSEALERQKGQRFAETKGLVDLAMAYDPACGAIVDWRYALRDALAGKRVPADWLRDEKAVEAHAQEIVQQQQVQQQIQTAHGAGAAAEQVGKGVEALGDGSQA